MPKHPVHVSLWRLTCFFVHCTPSFHQKTLVVGIFPWAISHAQKNSSLPCSPVHQNAISETFERSIVGEPSKNLRNACLWRRFTIKQDLQKLFWKFLDSSHWQEKNPQNFNTFHSQGMESFSTFVWVGERNKQGNQMTGNWSTETILKILNHMLGFRAWSDVCCKVDWKLINRYLQYNKQLCSG